MSRPTPAQMAAAHAAAGRIKRKSQMLDTAMRAVNRMVAQDDRWGPSDHPDAINEAGDMDAALDARLATATQQQLLGSVTWRTILDEEVAKLYASRTPEELMDRLTDVAAVAGSWRMRVEDRLAGNAR